MDRTRLTSSFITEFTVLKLVYRSNGKKMGVTFGEYVSHSDSRVFHLSQRAEFLDTCIPHSKASTGSEAG